MHDLSEFTSESAAALHAVVQPDAPASGLLWSLFKIMDGMASLKLNRFHWHLTDSPGWRLESKRFPDSRSGNSAIHEIVGNCCK